MQVNELTHKIIGCAIEVHKALGLGLLESAYEECLSYELLSQGLNVERQKPLPLEYKGVKMDCGYRLDLLVNNQVVIEIKSVESIVNVHKAQLMTYLKLTEKKVGLLINFNVTVLKDGIVRWVI